MSEVLTVCFRFDAFLPGSAHEPQCFLSGWHGLSWTSFKLQRSQIWRHDSIFGPPFKASVGQICTSAIPFWFVWDSLWNLCSRPARITLWTQRSPKIKDFHSPKSLISNQTHLYQVNDWNMRGKTLLHSAARKKKKKKKSGAFVLPVSFGDGRPRWTENEENEHTMTSE